MFSVHESGTRVEESKTSKNQGVVRVETCTACGSCCVHFKSTQPL